MGFGNTASTAPLTTTTPPVEGGFLAFLKGWEDVVSVTNSTNGDVTQVHGCLGGGGICWGVGGGGGGGRGGR